MTHGTPAPAGSAGVVRVTRLRAREGRVAALVEAAIGNAASARHQPGCVSAEVCTSPDDPLVVLVVSRWASGSALQAFLSWHQGIARDSVAAATAGEPRSVHYPVVNAAA